MRAGRSGGCDAQIRLGLGKMQDLGAVGEHRGRGFPGIESSFVHLAEMGHEVGLQAAGPMQELGKAAEQLVVREPLERARVFHGEL